MQTLERKEAGAFRGDRGNPCEIDTKAITDQGDFEGYLSVFGNVDQGGDIVMPGAFTASLQRRPPSKVKLLLHHDTRRIAGTWTDLVEDNYGLKAKGRLLLTTTDGREAYEQMKVGALDGLSIGYRTLADEIDRATGTRKLKTLDLMEGSICTFPMNPEATVSTVKSIADFTTQDWRDLEAALRDEGLSRADAVKAVSGFKSWLQRDAGGPDQTPRDEATPADTATLLALRRLAATLRG
jgi:HK97 family phage prohead protease